MKKVFAVILVFLIVFSGFFMIYANEYDPFDYAKEIYDYILRNYYGDIFEDILAENLVKALAQSLDEYSVFMSPNEAGTFFDSISGEFVGIGISFVFSDGAHRVLTVMKRSPARQAGILPGDLIYFVDDIDVRMLTSQETAALIKGPEGEEVLITIKRDGVDSLLEFLIKREKITVESATFKVIDNDVGYIDISSFNQNTYSQVLRAVDHFKSIGIYKVVLDLRNNGGGLVSQAVLVAGIFVGEGDITRLEFFNPDHTDITYVSSQEESGFDLVVLVNENTASAAELAAAAIQENDSGLIIGQNTFGKGIFQTGQYVASYEDYKVGYEVFGVNITSDNAGGYLHMTTGRYLTPLGNDIHGLGIEPDILIANDEDKKSIKYIELVSDYFNYDAGGQETVMHNTVTLLDALGYDTASFQELIDSIKEFQKNADLIETGEMNYITKRALDYYIEIYLMHNDYQLREALKHID